MMINVDTRKTKTIQREQADGSVRKIHISVKKNPIVSRSGRTQPKVELSLAPQVEELEAIDKPLRILRKKALLEKLGISRSTLHDWLDCSSPRFCPELPRAISLSATGRGAVGWLEDEIDQWLITKAQTCRK